MRLNLLFFCFCIVLFSCKKDKVKPNSTTNSTANPSGNGGVPSDYSHLEGVFHFEITKDVLYAQSQSRNYDNVQTMSVTGDTLNFGLTPFIISSDTQTVFTYSSVDIFQSITATLVYSNNFQDIQYDSYSNSLSFGPDIDVSYTGSRTNLLPTGNPHPYLNEIESDYIMEVTKKDYSTGLDTSYVDTLTVTVSNPMIFNIDNSSWDMPGAHTYYDYRYEVSGSSETVNLKKWYRTQDSLYVENMTYVEVWSNPQDTIQTVYSGKKL